MSRGERYLFELRDHGEQYGVECQIFRNGEFWSSRRFDPWLDVSRRCRDLAIQWAEEMRIQIEANPNAEILTTL